MLQTSPLKQNLVLRFEKGLKDYLGLEDIGKLRPEVIFAFPGSFLFCVVAPLNLEKLDASSSGSSKRFFQNADGYFGIGQVIVYLYGPMVDILDTSVFSGTSRHLRSNEIWNTLCTADISSSSSNFYDTSPRRLRILKGPIYRGANFPLSWKRCIPFNGDTFR